MMIDSHQHVFWHGRDDAGLIADMDAHGIDVSWLLSWEILPHEDSPGYHGVLNPLHFRDDGTHKGIPLSDLLLARVTVVAPYALHYVMIDDPLPAGLEAVDQSLSTSPQSVEVPQEYSSNDAFWRGWGWWYFSNIQRRDEKVLLSASSLPAGTYIYTYLVRASTAGSFNVIPTTAQEFYFPEVYGRGAGSTFVVEP